MSQLDSPRPIGTITGESRAKAAILSLTDYGFHFAYEPAEPYSDAEWYVLEQQVFDNLRGEQGPGYQAATQHAIDLEERLPAEPPTTAKEQPVDDDTTKKRPAYERDHHWLKWSVEEGLKPTAIRNRWNSLSEDERKAISNKAWQKVGQGNSGRATVYDGLKRAKGEQ